MFNDKLILDIGNYFPNQINKIDYELFTFSAGEPHIKLKDFHSLFNLNSEFKYVSKHVVITCRANSFNAVGEMLVAVDALRKLKIEDIDLFIPYFPAARQDRINVVGEAFTLKVYAAIINSLNFNTVYVLDPHSEVTNALVKNIQVMPQYCYFAKYLLEAFPELPKFYLVAPDEGAQKRVGTLAKYIPNVIDIVTCIKKRDVTNGDIIGLNIFLPEDFDTAAPLIVADDLVDGGRTFNVLAEKLREKGISNDLHLFVSHGIFSKGFDELKKHYKTIGCTASFNRFNEIITLEF